ncbi:uncharacterized protein isoform X1 [Rhodnius prolixus]|uniref:Zf-AD domain-containing protein n=1 Tax=Rhodnius prolixus TaxID=13249 RepID=T1HRR0_RHOPR
MQLKLSVGVSDSLTIDVEPTDTFQDLSDRLYSLGNVKVDLSQLRSSNNDKPFDMSTNVIEYFTTKAQKDESKDELNQEKALCRLCSEPIIGVPHFLFEPREEGITLVERVNAALPIHVTVKDPLPKQICSSCLASLNTSYNFMKKVVESQKTLEKTFKERELDEVQAKMKNDCCPLCAIGHLKNVNSKKSSNGPSNRKENVIRKDVVISMPRNMAIKKEPIDNRYKMNSRYSMEDDADQEYYLEDEVVTGFWDRTNSHSNNYDVYGIKRYKKRNRVEDDTDWTIDEEYIPVSRRGRPKGTKNKPKVINLKVPVVEKSCALCGWLGAETDMLAHAINQHCQPDMEYFPCPLCKTNQANEMVLETHIDRHNMRSASGKDK